jgi:hypothetical protein
LIPAIPKGSWESSRLDAGGGRALGRPQNRHHKRTVTVAVALLKEHRTKLVYRLDLDIVSGRPLLTPIYRWLGLKVPVGFYTDSPCYGGLHNVSLFEYNIHRLLLWAFISMDLNPNISQGYQCHGPWQVYPCQQGSRSIWLSLSSGWG